MSTAEAMAGPARCPHCGTAVEGPEDAFCCNGCRMAATIIEEAGLDRYYAEREALPDRPAVLDLDWKGVPTTTHDDGTCSVRLAVDGLKCASCVWVTEHVLDATPGVRQATVSYATGRAQVRWDPTEADLDDIARRIATLGYTPRLLGEERTPDRDLLVRLGLSAFLAANLMGVYAALYTGWFDGMAPRYLVLFRWLALALATPIALWAAGPFFAGAWAGLRHRVLHMDLPVSLAVILMYAHGVWATLAGHDAYLDSLAMLVTLLLAGRVLEGHGRRRASEAATALAAHLPRSARRRRPDGVETVPVDELRADDLVLAGPGVEIAVDGVVHEGEGQVQSALLTGESEPAPVRPGSRVVAGSVVLDGSLTIRAEQVGEQTLLHRMADGLREAADRGMRPTAADRIAPWFTAATLLLAAATFAGWALAAGPQAAVATTVAVLVVACPCALALSQPLAATAGLGAAARRGLLLRSGDALVDLAEVDEVALDKTGTLTRGRPEVVEADDAVLRIAAGLERYSHHPVARAILAEAIRRGIPLPEARGVQEVPGRGVVGVIDETAWELRSGDEPGTVALTGPDGLAGTVRLRDVLRDDAGDLVADLQRRGLRVVLLTGDQPAVAERIGTAVGVDAILAARSPDDKTAWIRDRQEAGRRVLFAGDGLNDGPALAAADVGVAMGSGAASSVLVADGALARPAVRPLVVGLDASRIARRAIRHNLLRSLAYNVLAVGAAVAGFVNPLIAAVLMPASSLMVVWGASRVEGQVARKHVEEVA